MVRVDFNEAEYNLVAKVFGEAFTQGNLKKKDIEDAQAFLLKMSQNKELPPQIPVDHFTKYKGFIRDGDRLSNEESIKKYGITIDELRTEVADFVTELRAGNKPVPRDIVRPVVGKDDD